MKSIIDNFDVAKLGDKTIRPGDYLRYRGQKLFKVVSITNDNVTYASIVRSVVHTDTIDFLNHSGMSKHEES